VSPSLDPSSSAAPAAKPTSRSRGGGWRAAIPLDGVRDAARKKIQYRLDLNTLHRDQETKALGLNEIGRVHLRTTVPMLCDLYSENRTTGSFILIDEATGVTVGGGMINSGS